MSGPPVTDQLADTAIAVECTKEGHAAVYDELTGSLTPEVRESVLQFRSSSGELEGHGAHPEDATVTGEETLAGLEKEDGHGESRLSPLTHSVRVELLSGFRPTPLAE